MLQRAAPLLGSEGTCRKITEGKGEKEEEKKKKENKKKKEKERKKKKKRKKTRPDTRPSVADGWAGAEMRVFPLFNSITTDQPTNQPTNRPMDGWTKPLKELGVRN